jgi:endonuclease-3
MVPEARSVLAVQRLLRASQGPFVPKPRLPVIDEVVATVLSQHTSDRNSERAFAQLKAAFPDWEQVLSAPERQVADAIRCGGIADQKARRIQQILAAIREREGRVDLSRLHDLDDAAVEEYLTSLPGIGPKTAACVLVFSMGRPAFPVDTHVHRVATRLGWIPPGTTAEKAYRLLSEAVPPGIRYDLHLALIGHGRAVCKAQRPRCDACVLRAECAYDRETPRTGGTEPESRRPRGSTASAAGTAERREPPPSRSGKARSTGGSVIRLGRSDIVAEATLSGATDTGVCSPTNAVLRVHGSGSVVSATPIACRNHLPLGTFRKRYGDGGASAGMSMTATAAGWYWTTGVLKAPR